MALRIGENQTYVTLRTLVWRYFVRFTEIERWPALRCYLPLTLGICSVLLAADPARAAASLFIYPTLIMFEANERSAEVTIANRGDEIGTFEIAWTDMSMTSDGGLRKHDEPTPWSVQPFVRYSPRRVTLEPSQSQVIKIAVRRDETVPEGEYFSHLRVITINSEDPDAADAPTQAPGVSVTARTAIAIPVVWRNSREISQARIDKVSLDPESGQVLVNVRREGLLSVRGYLHLLGRGDVASADAFAEPVPLVIYPNIDARSVAIPLKEGMSIENLPAEATIYFSADELLDRNTRIFAQSPLTTVQ